MPQKGQKQEGKSCGEVRLIVYADCYAIISPMFCQKAVKQTDETDCPYKRFNLSVQTKPKRNKTITFYCHTLYIIYLTVYLGQRTPN